MLAYDLDGNFSLSAAGLTCNKGGISYKLFPPRAIVWPCLSSTTPILAVPSIHYPARGVGLIWDAAESNDGFNRLPRDYLAVCPKPSPRAVPWPRQASAYGSKGTPRVAGLLTGKRRKRSYFDASCHSSPREASNPGPAVYETAALPSELQRPVTETSSRQFLACSPHAISRLPIYTDHNWIQRFQGKARRLRQKTTREGISFRTLPSAHSDIPRAKGLAEANPVQGPVKLSIHRPESRIAFTAD